MIAQELEFHAPARVEEAVSLLERYGGEAKALAGGMSLVPTMNLGLARPAAVVSLNRLADLAYVAEERSSLRIGALTRHREVERNELIRRRCPLLGEAAASIGDVQVRHRGTIGGSLAHADPAADYLPVLVVTGATATALGPGGRRSIPVRELVVDVMRTEPRALGARRRGRGAEAAGERGVPPLLGVADDAAEPISPVGERRKSPCRRTISSKHSWWTCCVGKVKLGAMVLRRR